MKFKYFLPVWIAAIVALWLNGTGVTNIIQAAIGLLCVYFFIRLLASHVFCDFKEQKMTVSEIAIEKISQRLIKKIEELTLEGKRDERIPVIVMLHEDFSGNVSEKAVEMLQHLQQKAEFQYGDASSSVIELLKAIALFVTIEGIQKLCPDPSIDNLDLNEKIPNLTD